MKRRKFLVSTGGAILGSSTYSILQEPAIGISFELSGVPNKDPTNIDSLSVGFEKLLLQPHYLDENSDISVTATLRLNGIGSKKVKADGLSFTNEDEIDLSNINSINPSFNPIVIDEVKSKDNFLDGKVTIDVTHPDLSTEYTQSFTISSVNSPTGRSKSVSKVYFSRDTDQAGNQVSTYVDNFLVDGTAFVDFESGDTSDWNSDLNNSTFSTTTNTTYEGSYSGELVINWDSNTENLINSVEDTQGDKYSFIGRLSSSPNGDFWWGWKDPNGGSLFRFIFVRQSSSNGYAQFRTNESSEMTGFSLNNSTWYRFIVRPDWNSASAEYEIQELDGTVRANGQLPFDPTLRFNRSNWTPPKSVTNLTTESITKTDYDGGVRKGFKNSRIPKFGSLKRYYPLQEGSGPTAYDVSNTQNGDYTNTTLGTSGPLSTNSPSFNGSRSYVDTGYQRQPNKGSFYLMTYIPSGSSGGNIFGMDSTRPSMAYKPSSDQVEFTIYDGNSQNPVYHDNPPKDQWITYAINFGTSDGIELYAYGSRVGKNDYTGTWQFLDRSDMHIGSSTDPNDDPKSYFDGKVWLFMLWEGINLTSSEIQSLHNVTAKDGNLTTQDIKSGYKIEPDLVDLDYNLNGGSIELEIVGSPDSSNTESITRTLAGQSSYALSWNKSHKKFRIRIYLNTSNIESSPEFFSMGIE